MKRYIAILLLLVGLEGFYTHTQVGCLANSVNRKQRFDTKAYHPVSCNCPCGFYKRVASRNQCTECGHFHDAKPLIIVSPSAQANLSKDPYPESPQKALQDMIKRSKKTSECI